MIRGGATGEGSAGMQGAKSGKAETAEDLCYYRQQECNSNPSLNGDEAADRRRKGLREGIGCGDDRGAGENLAQVLCAAVQPFVVLCGGEFCAKIEHVGACLLEIAALTDPLTFTAFAPNPCRNPLPGQGLGNSLRRSWRARLRQSLQAMLDCLEFGPGVAARFHLPGRRALNR